jgi:hypothetical protein
MSFAWGFVAFHEENRSAVRLPENIVQIKFFLKGRE